MSDEEILTCLECKKKYYGDPSGARLCDECFDAWNGDPPQRYWVNYDAALAPPAKKGTP